MAFLLEPDLKEGRGGLRDVHAVQAAALAAPVMTEDRLARLDAAEVLMRARVAMQRQNGRGEQLVLQAQDGVARALGLPNPDALMQGDLLWRPGLASQRRDLVGQPKVNV